MPGTGEGWSANVTQLVRALAVGAAALLLVGCDAIDGVLGTCRAPSDTETFAFEVEWTRVVQANQTATNLAPILAGQPTGVEVLLTMVDGELRPRILDVSATVDVSVDDERVGSLELELGCVRGERSAMRGTIPAAWIRSGVQVQVSVRSATPNVSVPGETFVVDPIVAEVPVFDVTIVPLIVGGTHPDTSRAVYEGWIEQARRRFAIDRYDLEIHPPLDLGLGGECAVPLKFTALQELWFYWSTLESERFFVGVLPCSVGGVAFMPGFVQVTSQGPGSVRTFLHELGHNFGLAHAPCGDPLGIDPGYPYSGGVLGLPGFDAGEDAWIAATSADLMGYCQGWWLSDYHYARSARYRMVQERPPVLATLADEPWPASVLVQGQLRPDGTVIVTHAVRRFEPTQRRPTNADEPRDTVRIEVVDRDGAVLVGHDATLVEVDHVDTRLFSARIGVTDAAALAARAVRASYAEEHATRALVDGD